MRLNKDKDTGVVSLHMGIGGTVAYTTNSPYVGPTYTEDGHHPIKRGLIYWETGKETIMLHLPVTKKNPVYSLFVGHLYMKAIGYYPEGVISDKPAKRGKAS